MEAVANIIGGRHNLIRHGRRQHPKIHRGGGIPHIEGPARVDLCQKCWQNPALHIYIYSWRSSTLTTVPDCYSHWRSSSILTCWHHILAANAIQECWTEIQCASVKCSSQRARSVCNWLHMKADILNDAQLVVTGLVDAKVAITSSMSCSYMAPPICVI